MIRFLQPSAAVLRRCKAVTAVTVVAASTWVMPMDSRIPKVVPSHGAKYGARTPTGNRRGRPRKFSRPSRRVALTLPEDVIASLQAIDPDLSRAVARTAVPALARETWRQAELATFGGSTVIIVPNNRVLTQRTGVELVPIGDGRALLTFDERVTIPQLELQIGDVLNDGALSAENRVLFEQLAEILASIRRTSDIEMRQRSIVVMHRKGTVNVFDESLDPAARRRA
jgi:hypothetical protein